MKISLTTKIIILFGLLIVIVFFNFKILIDTDKETNEQISWVLHTNEVIRESERLLGYLRDAETGQRGFLITLNNSYLEPFYEGTTQSQSEFSLIKKLTEDNMAQQRRLSYIQYLMLEKISELEKTIQLAQQDKVSEAIEIVNNNFGKNVMDNIRERMRELISVEENLLRQRSAEYLQNKKNLKELFNVEVIIIAMLIISSCIFVQKTIVRPLTRISKYIANAGYSYDGTGIKLKTIHHEIGTLAEALNNLLWNIQDKTNQKDDLISELKIALNEIKTLKGIIPICSHCKNIRDDKGYWNQIESYIREHSEAKFSHGICQECAKKYYPDAELYDDNGEVTED